MIYFLLIKKQTMFYKRTGFNKRGLEGSNKNQKKILNLLNKKVAIYKKLNSVHGTKIRWKKNFLLSQNIRYF
ncbi:hypothetical protein EBR03_02180 [bacterium]|nr:hypothetical protein [bacterium]